MAQMCFGRSCCRRSAADLGNKKAPERAPERGKRTGRKERGSRSPMASNPTGVFCREAEVRREITTSSKRLGRRSKREREEGIRGYL
jgi:hypothetical protein